MKVLVTHLMMFEYINEEDAERYMCDSLVVTYKAYDLILINELHKRFNRKKRVSIKGYSSLGFIIDNIDKRRLYTKVIDIKNFGEEDLKDDSFYDGYINSVINKYKEEHEFEKVMYLGEANASTGSVLVNE